jgi:hypothetical protein
MKSRMELIETTDGWIKKPCILFTWRESPTGAGTQMLFCHSDGHNEATDEYIKLRCKLPENEQEKQDCAKLLNWYKETQK